MRQGLSSSHETMITALACAMAGVLEHSAAMVHDQAADQRLTNVFKALADDHREFARHHDLDYYLRLKKS